MEQIDKQMQNAQAALQYFRSHSIWKTIFCGFREKYRSYGRMAGSIVLYGLTLEDIEELEGFFGKSFHGKTRVSISVKQFQRALADSRYHTVTLQELLELYFAAPLTIKKEEQQLAGQARVQVLEGLAHVYHGTPAEQILPQLALLIKKGKQDIKEWERQLSLGADIWNALPYRCEKTVYLAVFAAKLTGNPHAFDAGTADGAYFYQVVELNLSQRRIQVPQTDLFPAFKRQRSLLMVGILLDDVSNCVLLSSVRAKLADGMFHAGMDGFFETGDIVQLPLAMLTRCSQLLCVNHELFIVENPSVFAALCGMYGKTRSFLCMNGQPRLAGLIALELFAASGTAVYYAGDFDPEGLLIAQKLAHFYQGNFSYWHMGVDDYMRCCSQEQISDKRLKALARITDAALLPVVVQMQKLHTAGYQEMLLEVLADSNT